MPKETKDKTERKPRSANRKYEELTLNEQRTKLLRQLSKQKGIISRNKARYEAITPNKISKNKDLEETKADYKKSYEEAETKRVEVSTQLKTIDVNIKEAKKLKADGKDTSHVNVKMKAKKGRPKKKEGDITYKTVITPGPPLEKKDFIDGEWMTSMKMKWAIDKLQKQNKQIDDIIEKAKKAGTDVHGIDEEEYDRINKEINKLTKEREAFINIIRKRAGKEDIITKVANDAKDAKEKKAKGRPKKEKVEVEKKPKGRPKKEKETTTDKPKKETYLSFVKANWKRVGLPDYKSAVSDPKMKKAFKQRNNIVVEEVDAKHVAKEVVSKKLKSIVDEIIKDHTPVKKEKKVNPTEVINTNNDFEAPKKKQKSKRN